MLALRLVKACACWVLTRAVGCCWVLQEKVRDWGQRFAPLGVTCRELTGTWVLRLTLSSGSHLMSLPSGSLPSLHPAAADAAPDQSPCLPLTLHLALPPFWPLAPPAAPAAGDTDQEGMEGLDAADIICATPEKFDAVTRSGMRFFSDIGLVLIGGCWAAGWWCGGCWADR